VSLLHEAGHVHDPHLNSVTTQEDQELRKELFGLQFSLPEEKKANKETTQKVAAHILRAERNAWAYALKKLRPFFEGEDGEFLTEQAVMDLIHNDSLDSYAAGIYKALG
jgi:hypothetical protein